MPTPKRDHQSGVIPPDPGGLEEVSGEGAGGVGGDLRVVLPPDFLKIERSYLTPLRVCDDLKC